AAAGAWVGADGAVVGAAGPAHAATRTATLASAPARRDRRLMSRRGSRRFCSSIANSLEPCCPDGGGPTRCELLAWGAGVPLRSWPTHTLLASRPAPGLIQRRAPN